MHFKLDLGSLLENIPSSAVRSPTLTRPTLPSSTGTPQLVVPPPRPLTIFPEVTPDFTGTLNLVDTKYKVRDYQAVGAHFLRNKRRAFLVDKPGLGKTLQAAIAATPPVLILAPTYLTYNWYNFLCEVVPADTVRLISGSHEKRADALALPLANWTICNIEMLRTYDMPEGIQTVIIDEAHHLRGRDSHQTRKAQELADRVPNVFLLTATPILNRPDDLYSQLRLLDRKAFNSYWQFTNTHCNVINNAFGPKVVSARPSLKTVFEQYSLGRTYKDVQMQLPELVSDVITIEPPDEFKKLYRDLRDRYFVPGRDYYENALEVLQALRKITAPQKLKPLLSLLSDTDALSGTVIFSWYKETAQQVAELLDIPCVTGDMAPKERLRIAQSAQCISATISSMSEGVDLSHLHTVVFFELDYVPGTLYQALSRVRRHGQVKTVNVYYLVVKQTIDQILYNLGDARTRTINQIVREALE